MSTPIQLGFLGCGNIGTGVFRLITDFAKDLEHRTGKTFQVKKVLVRDLSRKRSVDLPPEAFTTDVNEILNDPEIGIVLEFLGGEEPAHTYMCRALRSGKTVITANKVAFSLHWPELHQAAVESGAGLFYEAAVCGAIPIIHTLEASLQANRIDSLFGIVNGTTNYILSTMSANGTEYAEALSQAQQLGLAEPDPSSDVDGLDAAYKLCILAALAFHGRVPFEDVYVEGISGIQAEDLRCGQEMGYTLKLLAIAKRNGLKVETRVHPTFLRSSHPMANVNGSFNAVYLKGHACGEMMFMGKGAGAMPTASAIVSDLLRAVSGVGFTYPTFDNSYSPKIAFENNTDWVSRFYVRVQAKDEPGVLSQIAKTLADHNVSISEMRQKNASADGTASMIFVTHPAHEHDLQAAVRDIPGELGAVRSLIRVDE